MKKIKIKLQLKTHTIRTLQVNELEQVNGGDKITFECTEVQMTCNFAADLLPASGQRR